MRSGKLLLFRLVCRPKAMASRIDDHLISTLCGLGDEQEEKEWSDSSDGIKAQLAHLPLVIQVPIEI